MARRALKILTLLVALFAALTAVAAQVDPEAFARLPRVEPGPLSPDGRFAVFFDQRRGGRVASSSASRTKRWLGNRPGQQTMRLLRLDGAGSLYLRDAAKVQFTGWWLGTRYLLLKRRDRASGRLLDLVVVDVAENKLHGGTLDQVSTVPVLVASRNSPFIGPEFRVASTRMSLPEGSSDVEMLAPLWKDGKTAILGVKFGRAETRIFRFDAAQRALTALKPGLEQVVSWVFDDAGQARAAVQTAPGGKQNLMFRNASSSWSRAAQGPAGWVRLLSFDRLQDRIWLSSSLHRERFGIFWLSPEEGRIQGPFFEDPEFDVTDIAADPADGHLLYVHYEADRLRCVYFDAPGSLFHARIDAALPDTSNDVLSASLDGKRGLIAARSDSAPTRYYLLDMRSNALLELYRRRPWLKSGQIGATRTVRYKNRAGLERWGRLTRAVGAGKEIAPLVLLLHDGPGGGRAEHRFDPMSQMLASSGLTVLSVDHAGTRGHGKTLAGYQDADLLADMEADLADAVDWAQRQHLAQSGRICVVGSGLGGQASEAALLRNPALRCAVGIHTTDAPLVLPGEPRPGPGKPSPNRALLVIQNGAAGFPSVDAGRPNTVSGIDRLALDLSGVATQRRTGVVYHAVLDFLQKHLGRQQQAG